MANIRWTRRGFAGLTLAALDRDRPADDDPADTRGAISGSGGPGGSAGSGGPDGSAAGTVATIRRSNSASVMLGRDSPVRLSGPGIPPRRIEPLLIASPSRR